MIIPTEARATIAAYREGRSPDEFLNDAWARREFENPRCVKPSAAWPFVRAEDLSNVTAIKGRKRA